MKHRCPVCKRIYTKKRDWQRWCSDRCGNVMRLRRRQTKIAKALKLMERGK